ncbi:uncharacterized protein LOC130647380 [Hydractinia symbiolongicarpus]|uniref:uncharacterized protein LOC130647380 n=1 Tax=Hydractinia symbiolongicarpus TaxID=13093 RepID=UPI002550C2DD|nr:uncharacterized protein LOC130647380 [Hydractinia symbiolongicarpus]
MTRSRFKNIYNKHPSIKNWENFKRQRNKCVTVCRDAKRIYYTSLNMNNIFDNKKFWKTVKPIFSNKCVKDTVQVIVENDQIICEKEHIANIINDHFVNVTNSLNIDGIPHENYNDIKNDIENVIKNYEQHPSIIWIKKHVTTTNKMRFKSIEIDIMKKYIGNLKENKSGPKGAIPPCFLKYYVDVYGEHLNKLFEKSIVDEVFPGAMKLADICPLFKNGDRSSKLNYRPVSKLSSASKIFERIMFDQIYEFIDNKLSPLLSGFRKGFSSQHVLLHMIESWRKDLDKGNAVGALLMDLSKAFDCVDHNLLIAKLHAYGFSKSALGLLRSFLTNRFQRVGIDGYFSLWKEIISGVPQDDNTLYTYGKQFEEIKLCLESAFSTVSTWFSNNGLQLNSEKQHVLPLCKKANAKINALKRISPYMSNYKRNVIANSFISSIFNYCPLIWGFSSRDLLHKVNSIHSRANRLLCDRIENECRISIHEKFCRKLLKEVFKTKMKQNPSYMNDVFVFKNTAYSFRASSSLERCRTRTTKHGLLSVSYIASKLWEKLPNSVRNAPSLSLFHRGLNTIPFIQCSCRLCATYICNVGYTN